jgi:hypothetical protein
MNLENQFVIEKTICCHTLYKPNSSESKGHLLVCGMDGSSVTIEKAQHFDVSDN